MHDHQAIEVDFLEAGSSGRPVVVLVHSSISGARMWRRLMQDLSDRFLVRAVNLFGYGKTPPWKGDIRQSLNDQARLVEAGMPHGTETVHLVGHSFGGLVAMKVAARLKPRATKLVLLEANPFYLLAQAGRTDAFAEAWAMRDCIKEFGALGEWPKAAEKFADYFGAAGSWAAMLPERQAAFAEAIKPNFFEWDCMDETTSMAEWAQLLPRETLVVTDPNTILPIREITALMREACPLWSYKEVAGGHMAPLTRPDLVNPLIVSFLRSGA